MINWTQGGNTVYLTGSWNNWKKKIRLVKSTDDFTTVIDMPIGRHDLKFLVDNEWQCAENLRIFCLIFSNLSR
jgi:5'-AMP-activated protein kinase regulatory beta subunit